MAKDKNIKAQFNRVLLLLSAVLGVAIVFGLILSERVLASRAGEARRTPVKVAIEWPPIKNAAPGQPATWLPGSLQRELELVASANISENPMDAASLKRAGEALCATGWVEAIDAMRREPSGVVSIRPRWRVPGAVVSFAGTDYLVSTRGDLLPVAYPAGTNRAQRSIVNVYAEPPAKPGEAWTGGDVQAALALLGYLQQYKEIWQQVASIDASQYVKHRRLVIVTDLGNRVTWGEAPGEFAAGEPGADVKLQRLLQLRRSPEYNRRIDGGQAQVDVSNPRGILGVADQALAEEEAKVAAEAPQPKPRQTPPTPAPKPGSRRTARAAG